MAAWALRDDSKITICGIQTQGELYVACSGPTAVEVWVGTPSGGDAGPYLVPPGQEAVFGSPGLITLKRPTSAVVTGFWWFTPHRQ